MNDQDYYSFVMGRIETFRAHCEKWGGLNQKLFHAFYVLSLLASGGTTIAGARGHKALALVIGACSTLILAYKNEWKANETAKWYGKGQNAAQRLAAELAKAKNREDMEVVSDALENLRSGDAFWGKTSDGGDTSTSAGIQRALRPHNKRDSEVPVEGDVHRELQEEGTSETE